MTRIFAIGDVSNAHCSSMQRTGIQDLLAVLEAITQRRVERYSLTVDAEHVRFARQALERMLRIQAGVRHSEKRRASATCGWRYTVCCLRMYDSAMLLASALSFLVFHSDVAAERLVSLPRS